MYHVCMYSLYSAKYFYTCRLGACLRGIVNILLNIHIRSQCLRYTITRCRYSIEELSNQSFCCGLMAMRRRRDDAIHVVTSCRHDFQPTAECLQAAAMVTG